MPACERCGRSVNELEDGLCSVCHDWYEDDETGGAR